MTSPSTLAIPAEWTPHRAMWVGWPSHGELWGEYFAQAQDEVEALVRALAGPGREQVKLMVGNDEALPDARARLDGVDWTARSEQAIPAGALCVVLSVDGATLTVRPDPATAAV